MELDLGGSWSNGPAPQDGSPLTYDAYEYRDRTLNWQNYAPTTTATLLAYGRLPQGGSMTVELWKVVDGVATELVVADDVPFTSDAFELHEIDVPAAGVATTYRLRATVTDASGLPVFFLGELVTAVDDEPPTTSCRALETALCNEALSHIGVTDQIGDVVTDETVAATIARLHLTRAIGKVLRDFPWGFATKYADLAWVAGTVDTPINQDWTYAYRLPTDCVMVRRIVRNGVGRGFDANPPAFREGVRDDVGRLLHSTYFDPDSADPATPTIHVEYTQRADCVVGSADDQFCEALGWLMAAKFAPALSKNKVTAIDAMQLYEGLISRAKVSSANEKQEPKSTQDADWIRERGGSGGCSWLNER